MKKTNKKICKGFKVVKVSMGALVSATACGAVRKYAPGKWARPLKADGPLCVFADKRSAALFIRSETNWLTAGAVPKIMEIRRCWYKPSVETKIWHVWLAKYNSRLSVNVSTDTRSLVSLPRGTVLASAVKLYVSDRKGGL